MKHLSSAAQILESSWTGLFRIGAIAALLVVLAFTADIIISFGGGDFNPAALTATDWFGLFQENWLAGLRALGFINVISLSVSVPLFLAILAVCRQRYQEYAVLALLLYLLGAAVYISNNAAIPMFVLSGKYAQAATEAQRNILAGAGEAVLAKGADFAPGSFVGFFLTELAGIGFSILMVGNNVFGKATAVAGILGFVLLSVFTIWSTFFRVYFEAAMLVASVGGLSSVVWYFLVSRSLFKIGRSSSAADAVLFDVESPKAG